MKIEVDLEVCQNYGQCVYAAPEIFDLDDAGELVFPAEVPDSALEQVQEAVRVCPVQAIADPA